MEIKVERYEVIESVNIKLTRREIEMMNWVLKYDKDILRMVIDKEKLLEPGLYPLQTLLKKLKKALKPLG